MVCALRGQTRLFLAEIADAGEYSPATVRVVFKPTAAASMGGAKALTCGPRQTFAPVDARTQTLFVWSSLADARMKAGDFHTTLLLA